jgi:hypothetical protein
MTRLPLLALLLLTACGDPWQPLSDASERVSVRRDDDSPRPRAREVRHHCFGCEDPPLDVEPPAKASGFSSITPDGVVTRTLETRGGQG